MGEGFNVHSLLQDLGKEPVRKQLVRGCFIKQLQPRTRVYSGTEKGLGSGNNIPREGRILPLLSLLGMYSSSAGNALNNIYHCSFS